METQHTHPKISEQLNTPATDTIQEISAEITHWQVLTGARLPARTSTSRASPEASHNPFTVLSEEDTST